MFEGLFQPMHLLVILGIALLIFGPKKLPELGRGLGDGIKGFKEAIAGKTDQAATIAPVRPPETPASVPEAPVTSVPLENLQNRPVTPS